MKTIVTHLSPDTDAITSVWLIHRFFPEWESAQVAFVPAGKTLHNEPADSISTIIHVDTGLGKFDHHQTNEKTCAARKVFEYLHKGKLLKSGYVKPLERLTDLVTEIDHFGEVFYPDAAEDRYDFLLPSILDGLRMVYKNDTRLVSVGEDMLDGILKIFSNKVKAEEEIHNGLTFTSLWGKTLAVESDNEETSRLAQKLGYDMVIRKGIEHGNLRIKTVPKPELNLEKLSVLLKQKDPRATWFFHASGHMILNGSVKNPDSIPTTLSLTQAVQLVRDIA